MKALVLEDYHRFVYRDVPVPACDPEDVLVGVKACGICGSDVHGMDGSTGRRIPPLIMGHEATGAIVQVGAEVSGWHEGDRVTFDSTIHCGRCHYCRQGRINLCDQRRVLGVSCEECRQDGALGSIVVSNSQKPGLHGKVHVHGSNGASVGVQTDGGAMFIAGMSPILEPPRNDVWTVPDEEHLLEQWQAEDRATFEAVDATRHYHLLQDGDFLQAILEDRAPMVSGEEGRKTVELFTAIYRSQRDGRPVRFPLAAEDPVD